MHDTIPYQRIHCPSYQADETIAMMQVPANCTHDMKELACHGIWRLYILLLNSTDSLTRSFALEETAHCD